MGHSFGFLFFLGAFVGFSVFLGAFVGFLVFLGALVGLDLGGFVSPHTVGRKEGQVGAPLGLSVRIVTGCVVGEGVGAGVASGVGAGVASGVGAGVATGVGTGVSSGIVPNGQIAEPVFTLLQISKESILVCPGLTDLLFRYMFHVATVGLLIVNVPYPYISACLKEELYGTSVDVLPNFRHFSSSGRCIKGEGYGKVRRYSAERKGGMEAERKGGRRGRRDRE